MTTATPRFGLTVPNDDGSDDADLAALLRALGLDVENLMPGIPAMTAANLAALTGDAKFEGLVVYETDTYQLVRCDGTNWRALAMLDASGDLPMAGRKVTGMGDGVASDDAATKAQVDGAMPTGAIIAYAGTAAPDGWHLCDGTAHGSAALLAVTGSATTPDLRGKFVLGVSGSHPSGQTGGEEAHVLTAGEMPAHSHTTDSPVNIAGSGALQPALPYGQVVAKGTTGTAGSGNAHNNMPPFYALMYIIKKT